MTRDVDAIYLRVSKEDQADPSRFSLPAQERLCRGYVDACGRTVGRIYVDAGKSAYNDDVSSRPAFQEFLNDAQAGQFRRGVVYSLDRFSRDVYLFHHALKLLEAAGVELVSATQYYDPATPDGELVRNIQIDMAHAESRRTSKRVHDSLQEKARQGLWVGHHPFGYCRGTCDECPEPTGKDCPRHNQPPIPHTREVRLPGGQAVQAVVLVPRPGDSDGYKFLVKLCLDGVETYREMARVMNGAGYRSVLGNPWNGTTVQLALSNPAYVGMVVLREPGTFVRRNALPGLHEPLVDREIWERVQARCRELSNGQAGMHKAARPYALSGVLYCARCGFRLVGMRTNRPAGCCYYRCSQRNRLGVAGCDLPMFRAEACEEIAACLLDSFILPESWQEQVLAGMNAPRPGPTLADVAAEEKRLTQMYQDGYVSYDDFKARWEKVQERRERIRPPRVDGVLEMGEMLSRGLGTLWRQSPDQRERRKLARAVFRSIYLDGERGQPPRVTRIEWQPEVEPLARYLRET